MTQDERIMELCLEIDVFMKLVKHDLDELWAIHRQQEAEQLGIDRAVDNFKMMIESLKLGEL